MSPGVAVVFYTIAFGEGANTMFPFGSYRALFTVMCCP